MDWEGLARLNHTTPSRPMLSAGGSEATARRAIGHSSTRQLTLDRRKRKLLGDDSVLDLSSLVKGHALDVLGDVGRRGDGRTAAWQVSERRFSCDLPNVLNLVSMILPSPSTRICSFMTLGRLELVSSSCRGGTMPQSASTYSPQAGAPTRPVPTSSSALFMFPTLRGFS